MLYTPAFRRLSRNDGLLHLFVLDLFQRTKPTNDMAKSTISLHPFWTAGLPGCLDLQQKLYWKQGLVSILFHLGLVSHIYAMWEEPAVEEDKHILNGTDT